MAPHDRRRVAPHAGLLWLGLTLALGPGCHEDGVDTPQDIVSRWDPAPVVVVVVVDTLARHTLMGWQDEFETNPEIDTFFRDATHFENVLAVRSVTSPAVASILTGTYPHTHGVRRNTGWESPLTPTLFEKFHDAGYHTMGFASNTCQFIDDHVDERFCTWTVEEPDTYATHAERDEALLAEFWERLDDRPTDRPLFAWLHLMNPHTPYTRIEPWYTEFHPEPYSGDIDASDSDQLGAAMLGEIPFGPEDMAHVRAVYMSQVRDTDRLFGELLDGMRDRGMLDDSVVVFGADHGESVGARTDYLFHGCSPFNDVLGVTFAIRAPGRLPQGRGIDGWVSQVDMGPTLADVAGLGWSGTREGVSLVDEVLTGIPVPRDLYFERDLETVGLLRHSVKYIRDENEGNTSCPPYDRQSPFPGDLDSLFDLTSDPAEATNLAVSQSDLRDQMYQDVCDWVTDGAWMTGTDGSPNSLVESCLAR